MSAQDAVIHAIGKGLKNNGPKPIQAGSVTSVAEVGNAILAVPAAIVSSASAAP